MKSARIVVLSLLAAFNVVTSVNAADAPVLGPDVAEAPAAVIVGNAAEQAAAQVGNFLSSYSNTTIGISLSVILVGVGAIGYGIKHLLSNREVELLKQANENAIQMENNKRRHELEDQATHQRWQARYNRIKTLASHFVQKTNGGADVIPVTKLDDSMLLKMIRNAAENIDTPIDDVFTRITGAINECDALPGEYPFSEEIPQLKKVLEEIKSRIATPTILALHKEQSDLALVERRKVAHVKHDENIADYAQHSALQKKQEIAEQKRTYDNFNQTINDLRTRQDAFETNCTNTLNTIQRSANNQLQSIKEQQETLNAQQAILSEQYAAVMQKLNAVATKADITALTESNSNERKSIKNALDTLKKDQGTHATHQKTILDKITALEGKMESIRSSISALNQTNMNNPQNWTPTKEKAPRGPEHETANA
jgi:hypothetical protein